MKIKTSELTGAALDWAVAKCEGRPVEQENGLVNWPYLTGYSPSTDWSRGGPIIEREGIAVWLRDGTWRAQRSDTSHLKGGPTPLIAAMRCYVASKLGDNIDIPEELCK